MFEETGLLHAQDYAFCAKKSGHIFSRNASTLLDIEIKLTSIHLGLTYKERFKKTFHKQNRKEFKQSKTAHSSFLLNEYTSKNEKYKLLTEDI